MVFSPIPAYLDRANWQQQPNHQSGSSGFSSQLPPPPPQPHVGGGGMGSIRPGSMSDRARMANIPMPETALKCPRCESSNTKFCYFNNYSLTQPRHFCKTCRRYWTRGGALRNVPVGGGCRRNKRSKASSSSSSKSPVSGDRHTASSSSASTAASSNSTLLGLSPQVPPLRFMAPLHQLTDYGAAAGHHMGLNYSGIISPHVAPTSHDMNYQIGNNSIGGGSYLSAANMEQWRMQQTQIPLFPGLEGASGLYPIFPGGIEMSGYVGEAASQLRPKLPASGLTQLDSVKMEETRQELNLSRQFLGSDQYWSTGTAGGWTDLSGFNSPSTSNPL